MASTRTPGITIGAGGRRFIDKRYHGIRIGMRVGNVTQEQADQCLHAQIQRLDLDLARRAHPRPLFRDCAARYLSQSHDMRSLEAIRVYVRLLMRHVGSLEPQAIVACDFLVAVTATFRQVYVFVVMHHGSRRLLHLNVTSHPTAACALQQLREVIGFDDAYHYLLHGRDSIFAKSLDLSIEALGLRVLKSPPHSPKANAICERLVGTIQRECLDWHIPISEKHLRRILISWADHYNHGRPHMSLGPGLPDPPTHSVTPFPTSRHRVGAPLRVGVKSVLGGLHHEYALLSATT